ncbi:DNA-binding protein [candidate division FCPU426 bacterium]|nr:DNA-binding protein [candidate division FCPU426 bacterium]
MDFVECKPGRIFLLKFMHGDNILDALRNFCKTTGVRSAFFALLGGLQSGAIVTGPKKPVIPPTPNWVKLKDGWEMLGVGSIFPDDETAVGIHLHTAVGKGSLAKTGCLRKNGRVFIVAEAMLYEIKGTKAHKALDPKARIKLLQLR